MGLFGDRDLSKYQERYKASVQEKVPGEQVLAVGVFYRTGSFGSAALAEVSGAAYMAARALGKKKAGGLSQNVLLAATPERIYAFSYAPRGTSIKVKGEEAVWNRADLEVEIENTNLTQRITISSPSEDERVTLDSSKGSGIEMNLPLLELLGAEQLS